MAYVERIDFEGFWGDRKFSVHFNPEVNFLIGVNGSGKTTVINTLASALTADFSTLDRLPFNRAVVTLYDPSTRKKPSIEVTKSEKKRSPFTSIRVALRESASSDPIIYKLDEIEEERYFREYRGHYPSIYRKAFADVKEKLNEMAPCTWLSIHRATAGSLRGGRDEANFESSVDKKLEEIGGHLVRFIAQLERQSSVEIAQVQQAIFLSLFHQEAYRLYGNVKSLDIAREKNSIVDMFVKFGIPEAVFSEPVETHFRLLDRAVERTDKPPMLLEDLYVLLNMWRIHSVVQEWNKLLEKQKEIFMPRDTFISVLNRMLVSGVWTAPSLPAAKGATLLISDWGSACVWT